MTPPPPLLHGIMRRQDAAEGMSTHRAAPATVHQPPNVEGGPARLRHHLMGPPQRGTPVITEEEVTPFKLTDPAGRQAVVAAVRVLVQHLKVTARGKPGFSFSVSEMRRCRLAFGREMERSGIRYALVYGANLSGSAVSWLTGWPVTREALLVAAAEPEDDVLLVSFFNHVPQARRVSVTQVEWAGAGVP
jgi:hypothetical protein